MKRKQIAVFLLATIGMAMGLLGCATNPVADADLMATIKAKLAVDPDTSAIKIAVDSTNGVVTLTGVVPTQKEKDRAEQVAKGVSGVQSVTNNITINPNSLGATNVAEKTEEALRGAGAAVGEAVRGAGSALNDAAIVTKIKTQLVANGISNTDVAVSKGEATLTGEVSTTAKKNLAQAIALKTGGVKSVKNQLTVKP